MADFEITPLVRESMQPAEQTRPEDDGLTAASIDSMLLEIRTQPDWRHQADIEADYYDNNQLDAETLALYEERGQAPMIDNLIAPTINVVLGMEAKTRTDWKVNAGDLGDEDMNQDVADALGVRLHKAEVESRADRACSDAYAGQVKVGLHWVEVSRESDPFKAPYRVKPLHRRELWWDWRAVEPDLSDARYLIRRKWYDEDVIAAAFPEHADVIRGLLNGVAANDMILSAHTGLNRALDVLRGSSIEEYEYINTMRKRLCVYEIWYKKMVHGHTLRLPNGRVVEFDKENQKHCDAVLNGMIQPRPATFMKMRVAYTIGAFKLHDAPTPYRHQHFPYVPFFGFREDRAGVPYGMIRAMKSPQDEVNARKSKMYHLLNSRRVTADGDAVKDHNKTAQEVARPDSYIILNENRKPNSAFKVEDGGQLANQQFEVMRDAKESISRVSGVYQSMMGQTSAATAASAINSLVEQGTTTLAEINDNYRFARRMVGELLLELVKEDLEGKPLKVKIEDGVDERVIELNVPAIDQETQMPILLNDVSRANVTVGIDDVSTSATFRQQQYIQLVELTKSLPPQAQGLIIDFVIEAGDQPNRKKMAERLRKGLGMQAGDDQPDPQVQQLQQQLQQLNAALQQAQAQLADKSKDYELKGRDLDIKAEAVAIDGKLAAEKLALMHVERAHEIAASTARNPNGLPQV